MATVLIGYVTKTGTTKEIAERIGARLTNKAISVQVKELGTVTSIDAFDAVILGSPINAMKLLPEFDSFVQSHPGLSGKTTGLFVVSYIHDHGRKLFRGLIQGSLRKARLKLQAKHSAVFGGRIDKPMPAAARWLFGLQSNMPVDIRNWNDIERWADNLAGELSTGTKAS